MNQIDLTGFDTVAAGKVRRLLALLDAMAQHPVLRSKVCLHGGTALNLFVLGAPRLSVDIDLNYIGAPDIATMRSERPLVEKAIEDVATRLGYAVRAGKAEHAGRSFYLQYSGMAGPDSIKIDSDYLNRSPLLPVTWRALETTEGTSLQFPLNADVELFAGKTKALLERVAMRDLYDVAGIANLLSSLDDGTDHLLVRRIMLYYRSIAAPFPRPIAVASRFAGREAQLRTDVYPLLDADDRPILGDLIDRAEVFTTWVATPRDDAEQEYLDRATRADYQPGLLFNQWPGVLAAANADPARAWKTRNLAHAVNASKRS